MENKTIHLLVIEDNPADFRILAETLKGRADPSYQTTWAGRLDEGLALLGGDGFDAVILDLDLPDTSGLETLHQMVKMGRDEPIIIMTGDDDEHLGAEAIRSGAADYLVKGKFDAHLLSRSIRYAIERKRAEDQVRLRVEELRAANEELARFNKAMVDREMRMIELKKQVNELCMALGHTPRYPLAFKKEKT